MLDEIARQSVESVKSDTSPYKIACTPHGEDLFAVLFVTELVGFAGSMFNAFALMEMHRGVNQ